jgi:hypothetical protein
MKNPAVFSPVSSMFFMAQMMGVFILGISATPFIMM